MNRNQTPEGPAIIEILAKPDRLFITWPDATTGLYPLDAYGHAALVVDLIIQEPPYFRAVPPQDGEWAVSPERVREFVNLAMYCTPEDHEPTAEERFGRRRGRGRRDD